MRTSKLSFLLSFVATLSTHAVFASPNCPNRPAGATTVLDTPFNTADGEGQLWEVYPGAGKLVAVSGNPGSAPYANASTLSPGQSTGGQQTIWPKPGNEQPLNNIYMCMTWKMNANFVGLRTSNKLFFIAAQDFKYGRAGMNGVFLVNPRGTYPSTSYQLIFGHNTGGIDNSHSCAADSGLICYPNVADTPLYPDRWYTIEALVISSTCPSCKNATVKWWINGALQGNYTNLNYGDTIINQFQINHTWDGSLDKQCGPPTNPNNPIGRDCTKEQIHYFDHVTLASVAGLSPSRLPASTPTPTPAPTPTPTPVPTTPSSFKTTLKAENSSKCVDSGTSSTTNVKLVQNTCSGASNQNFIFTKKADNFYEIRSEFSNKCVEHLNASTSDGASLVTASCSGLTNQLFRLEDKGGGRQKIHSKVNDKCVDVSGISVANGAEVFLWTCWSGTNENFFMSTTGSVATPPPVPAPTPTPPPAPASTLSFTSTIEAQHSGKCVDASATSTNGVSLVQKTCSGVSQQSFTFTSKGNGYYEIRSRHSNKCFENLNSSLLDGARLVQATCTGQTNQLFSLEDKGNSRYKIHSKVNNKCMDVSGISVLDGADVLLWTCWNGLNEIFFIDVP